MRRAVDTSAADARRRERRDQILRAARGCFELEGFRGASMANVAAAARMSVGHIYHYFESKDCIVAELIRDDLVACVAAFCHAESPAQLVAAMISAVGNAGQAPGDSAALSAPLRAEIMAEVGRNPLVASLIAETEEKCRRHLLALLPGKLQEFSTATADRVAAVEVVLALWRGLLIRGADPASRLPPPALHWALGRLFEPATTCAPLLAFVSASSCPEDGDASEE